MNKRKEIGKKDVVAKGKTKNKKKEIDADRVKGKKKDKAIRRKSMRTR